MGFKVSTKGLRLNINTCFIQKIKQFLCFIISRVNSEIVKELYPTSNRVCQHTCHSDVAT